jgi:hypothetical protein
MVEQNDEKFQLINNQLMIFDISFEVVSLLLVVEVKELFLLMFEMNKYVENKMIFSFQINIEHLDVTIDQLNDTVEFQAFEQHKPVILK